MLVTPFVVLAARFLGPGPTRLKLVKLAHQMDGVGVVAAPEAGKHSLRQVLPLHEALLLQMNDFDRLLEIKLRQMLDPVVATPPPARRGPFKGTPTPVLAVEAPFSTAGLGGAVAEMIPVAVEQPAVL